MTGHNFVLYNSFYCPYAARAVIAFEETGAEHEVVPIDLKVPRPEWYLKDINPYGQVPALKIDDKDILLESLIVAEYLADLFPEKELLPKDPLLRAKSRYLIQHWGNRAQPVQHNAAFTTNEAEAAQYRKDLVVELAKVNKLLLDAPTDGAGPYFLGSKFTLADLAIAPLLARLFLVGKYNANKPITREDSVDGNLDRFFDWKDALLSRPSVQKATPDEDALIESYRKFVKA
ncbi:MAG: thioredoxin-like protein [Benniella sp.]|nr:MAG: thioredoxin-like protein [Benniella sp.]